MYAIDHKNDYLNLINDTIIYGTAEYDYKLLGIKMNDCDRVSDRYYHAALSVDLPAVETSDFGVIEFPYKSKQSVFQVFIGTKKSESADSELFYYETGDTLIQDLNALDSIYKQSMQSVSEVYRDQIYFAVYADKSVESSMLIALVEKLKQLTHVDLPPLPSSESDEVLPSTSKRISLYVKLKDKDRYRLARIPVDSLDLREGVRMQELIERL